MGILGKYERHIDIVAKIFMIIILLFICYRIVVYDAQIRDLTRAVANIETDRFSGSEGMPVYMGASPAMNVPRDLSEITINITGAVLAPGVYTLDEGSRLIALIELAGGADGNADLERVNLAAHLHDASHIRIPFIGEEEDFSLIDVVIDAGIISSSAASSEYGRLVNINTASRSELEALPGVGPVIAGNIVEFRDRNGPFSHVEDLLSVNRVGSALFGSIRHLIEV